jgi:hypothetical protein
MFTHTFTKHKFKLILCVMFSKQFLDHAMAQAVSCQSVTMEAWVFACFSPRGICGRQSAAGIDFPPSSSVFSCQNHFAMARHTHISPEG